LIPDIAGAARALPRPGGVDLSWARPMLPLAHMGLFFGSAWVFVWIWEEEEHPDIPRDKVLSYMVLHRGFIRRLREDEDFYQEHFASVYADGLTVSQAEALKTWCAEKGVETVSLTTTMSFANWIFLGYFITWLLGGSVLKGLP
jgi:hypothetical protein